MFGKDKEPKSTPCSTERLFITYLNAFSANILRKSIYRLKKINSKKIVCAYLAEYAVKYFGEEQLESNSFTYRLKTILDNVMYLMKHIMEELSQSEFFVADCELKIGEDIPSYTIVLPDGHKIAVCGSVDRVDIMQRADITYLRIIDYKTGKNSLSFPIFSTESIFRCFCISIQSRLRAVTNTEKLYLPGFCICLQPFRIFRQTV